ncbi:MAG TPA: alpha/beta fold hydrolase [Kofleriaceae bacterium]|nr:alpha/beta fold hydrolase [Kofleriaceae bacterium]
MNVERTFATTADRVRLSLRRYEAVGPRRAVLLCTHAMMARGAYFERRFAPHLAARGIEVYVLDWRGHGESVPPSPRRERWGFDDYVEFDLPAAVGAVCDRAGIAAGELCYLGHSLGGLVGLAGIGTGVVPAPRLLTLWATSVWLPGPTGPGSRRAIMAIYRAATRPLGFAPIRALRLGTDDESRGYVEDLTGWAASGRFTSRTGIDYLEAAASITAPAWAVTGAGDRLSSVADARAITARLPACALRVVGRAHGDAIDADHFTLFTAAALAPLWDELSERLVA